MCKNLNGAKIRILGNRSALSAAKNGSLKCKQMQVAGRFKLFNNIMRMECENKELPQKHSCLWML